jgi:KUP system potassium uptake protein
LDQHVTIRTGDEPVDAATSTGVPAPTVAVAEAPATANATSPTPGHAQGIAALALGALGVVYGDIGTSPLYTVKEVFGENTGIQLTAPHVIGAVSTLLWGLMFIVTLKYVVLILRADNRGEGGIMALGALAIRSAGTTPQRRKLLLLVGVFGAALFYGDSIITPAISVLGAAEGLEVVAPHLKSWVVPISVGVLLGLFAFQRFGTDRVGKAFGPVILVWFGVLAVTGAWQIVQNPVVLQALDPLRAIEFVREQGWHLFVAVGAIVLALTGAEALYADMGHFGRRPIRLAWSTVVLPALALNYMGQGALLLRDPGALENPFFRMYPEGWIVPAVVLATAASVIASQAVISGAYSMTRQAIQLGFLPRMRIVFTSEHETGQIYMPHVNRTLLVAVLLAAVGFGSSSALAAAYGIAVTITMFTTTFLTYFVVRHGWGYAWPVALAATGVFLAVDAVLVISCALKFAEGGWFPLLLGAGLFLVMTTWKRGRERLFERAHRDDPELVPFATMLTGEHINRSRRTAVYFVADPEIVPQALLHNLKHNQVLHERNVVLTVVFHDVPRIPDSERVRVEALVPGFWRVHVDYGFQDSPDIPAALLLCGAHGLPIDLFECSYFISRDIIVPSRGGAMPRWREILFATMARNAGNVAEFFRLPDNNVVELGTRVQI